jgi:predicted secreted hydrolase
VTRIRTRVRRNGTRPNGFAAIICAICAVLCAFLSACSASSASSAAGSAGGGRGTAAPAANASSTAGSAVSGCAKSVSLPKDEAPHADPVEWWYFSGHLTGKDAKGVTHTYGYEYVIFQILGLGPAPDYLADLSVTDLGSKTFQFAGEEASYSAPKTPGKFALHAGSWTMSGGSGSDTLKAATSGDSLDLVLRATEPAVLEGNKCGYISLASLGSSYYYSWTSLATTGTFVDHGVTLKVTGTSWMDHQWGPITLGTGGWDWFSMQLSNGQQYMLFFIKNKKGQIVDTDGTRVADGGKDISYLTAADIREQVTGSWTSPATGIKYGSGWRVTVPGGQLTVTPDLRDQEVDLLKTQGILYWEGDVAINGDIDGKKVTGDGYTELNPPGVGP